MWRLVRGDERGGLTQGDVVDGIMAVIDEADDYHDREVWETYAVEYSDEELFEAFRTLPEPAVDGLDPVDAYRQRMRQRGQGGFRNG